MLREIVVAAAFIFALIGVVGSIAFVQRIQARQEDETVNIIEEANEID